MVIFSDISERVMFKASKVSEKIKTIMFCSISHELRSPLNHISGMHSLLKSILETEEQKGLMKIAESSTELLKIKIDDILDFYEVESGNFTVQKMQFDVRNQCKELQTVFSPLINDKRIKLLFYVNENTPKLVTHDACRIHKILVNLISNSVKYTKSGTIIVSIDWKQFYDKNKNRYEMKYSVSDTGRGISKQKRRELFKFLDGLDDKYLNCENPSEPETTSLAGTGLGISQKIAKELGSYIDYTSTVDIGSTFWFTMKIDEIYGAIPHIQKESQNIMVDIDSFYDASKSTKSFKLNNSKISDILVQKRGSFRCHLEESKLMSVKNENNKSKNMIQNKIPLGECIDSKFIKYRQ